MVNQSVRVQMSSETKLVLENLAQENGCLYGGKPHISGLLTQIADGRLVLNRAIPPQHSLPRAPLLKLRLWFPIGLKGTLAATVQKIADFGGNIFKAKVNSEVDKATAQILLSIPESSDLSAFITALQQIKIKDIVAFNETEEILNAMNQTKKLNYNLYKEQEPDTQKKKSIQDRLVANVLNQNLLLDISCTIGLKLVAHNQVGILAKVTCEIAAQGFFVSSVKQDFDSNKSHDIIEFLLTLQATPQNEMSKEIPKIYSIVKALKNIPAITEVQRLGIDYL